MSQTQINVATVSFKILKNNRLDNEIQKIAYSFDFAVQLFLFSLYNIKNNHIDPNGKIYHTSGIIFMFLLNSLCFYRMHSIAGLRGKIEQFDLIIFLIFFYFGWYCVVFTMMYIQNILHKNYIVELILKIQAIHRNIGYKQSLHSFVIINWISIATIIISNIMCLITFCASGNYNDVIELVSDNICHFTYVAHHINVIVATRIII
ncbi:hypothetical protein B5X24_HaOG201012 [Helicoverpa armigera]|nr:hypothetical protein B5X24_HaOG201012 [Helicoverpa armigera]